MADAYIKFGNVSQVLNFEFESQGRLTALICSRLGQRRFATARSPSAVIYDIQKSIAVIAAVAQLPKTTVARTTGFRKMCEGETRHSEELGAHGQRSAHWPQAAGPRSAPNMIRARRHRASTPIVSRGTTSSCLLRARSRAICVEETSGWSPPVDSPISPFELILGRYWTNA